jgi:hypothetical protein
MQSKGRINFLRAQSSRLAEFGGRGMSFNICRGTLGSLAMFTAIRNAYHLGRQENEYRSPGARLA